MFLAQLLSGLFFCFCYVGGVCFRLLLFGKS
jgi:hypothetical protein